MKKLKKFWIVSPVIIGLVAIVVIMAVFTATVENRNKLLLVHATVAVFAIAATLLINDYTNKSVFGYLKRLSDSLMPKEKEAVSGMPSPMVSVKNDGEIVWYNEQFRKTVLSGMDAFGSSIMKVFPKFNLTKLKSEEPFEIKQNKRWFQCSVSECSGEDIGKYNLFFSEITSLKETEQRYEETRPVVILIVFDNEEELLKERESERMRVMAQIDSLINDWVADSTGVCWADTREKSLILLESSDFEKIVENKFDILAQARQIMVKDNLAVTLSIGVGCGGKNIAECEAWARQALDMALGRGGDQAVVKNEGGYTFYGGVTNSSERQSRVRMRMSASALTELFEGCSNCFIMGHKYSDLDVVGAAIGVHSLVRSFGKEAHIAIDRRTSLAADLIDSYEKTSGLDCFMDVSDALDRVREGTLVVVVDTHSPTIVESLALYERATKTAVIDHHRMMVDHVENPTLFIQESYASSASELVTELATYIDPKAIGRAEAEALLAGIMLDTKSFVLKTGVRTFEASAFLRRRGADTVEVKRFFSGTLDTFRE
ncbi:MAG: DHH family phosphoesterase, partial [Clostridia bacterium]|nr:DHH family phosphoesterase [Clostridia bacterium]